ncbi:hypothetical protein EJB05_03251 [Eragrostis curvula]|uniref:Ribosomal silencing factor RsfS n=1 Tax=Eragrostis curvula TaxID=38414 RepID=A0A5J9WVV7_9POAL|nr:hypothetical protein EJB05_03251 [Eragrostis curvula]
MPSVQGQQAGKWVVIDSGSIIIHALEERAREYYNLESIWSKEVSPNTSVQVFSSLDLNASLVADVRSFCINGVGDISGEDTPQEPFTETHEEHLNSLVRKKP